MAFEKLSVPQEVIDQALTQARSAGEHAGFLALHALQPYSGQGEIFADAQVKAYAQRKTDETAEKFLQQRIAGEHNDKASKRPGLIALVNFHAMVRLPEIFRFSAQGDLFGIEFSPTSETKDYRELHIVKMPVGGYAEISSMTVEFSDIVEPFGDERVRQNVSASTAVRVSTQDVVTIVGTTGEYWQNRQYNIDGTYRQ